MPDISLEVFLQSKHLENTQTTQFTCSTASNGMVIDKLTVCNTSASPATVSINIVPNGGAAATENLVIDAKSIDADATYTFPEIVGHVLYPGDFVSTIASAATALSMRASGRVVR